jgi:hypothetical protein
MHYPLHFFILIDQIKYNISCVISCAGYLQCCHQCRPVRYSKELKANLHGVNSDISWSHSFCLWQRADEYFSWLAIRYSRQHSSISERERQLYRSASQHGMRFEYSPVRDVCQVVPSHDVSAPV